MKLSHSKDYCLCGSKTSPKYTIILYLSSNTHILNAFAKIGIDIELPKKLLSNETDISNRVYVCKKCFLDMETNREAR